MEWKGGLIVSMKSHTNRLSGIESLKIITLYMIVMTHVLATISNHSNEDILDIYQKSILPMGYATKQIKVLILNVLYQFGGLGNTIFFVCSAWFWVNNNKTSRKKAFNLLITVWFLSVIILGIYLLFTEYYISPRVIIKQFFPTTFLNNWYISCYILFLFIYPYLNIIINKINQELHLRIVLFSSIIWIILCTLLRGYFFQSNIITWGTLYFIIAYLKLYCTNFVNNTKINLILLFIGILGFIMEVVTFNFLGLHLELFSDKVLYFNSNNAPFHILIAIASLNLAQKLKFKNTIINYISSLSLCNS